ncbi:MAG: pyridoxal phosphate-dependent aminotransferase [Uliginosibacterium sp.]|jgi:aspartate/methionine/tyrosine aminotransferase|nr:pyridoxal phosphate-dependent aminotransferase [Uliginosibacterium sp.]
MRDIPPFHVMELLARAQQLQAEGCDVIHMEVGEPDFPTPEPVVEAAQAFIKTGRVHYTPALGLPELREAISAFYAEHLDAKVSADRIVVTAGASGALLLAVAALTDPGNEWLLSDPGYPCNRQFVQAFGGRVKSLPVKAQAAYQPDLSQVEDAWSADTKAVLIASPSNPTGTLIDDERLDGLVAITRQRRACLVVDEIYQGLVYGRPAKSVLARHDEVLVVNSFSKYFGMTGWRLGWLVVPTMLTRHIEKLAQHLYIAPSTPAQHAALAAFSSDNLAILEQRRQLFGLRRDKLLAGLQGLGFRIDSKPEGAFYIYANSEHCASDSTELSRRLLEHSHVATTPGRDFGEYLAQQHLRLAYTMSEARIEEALDRIRLAL